jgi:fucose permease
LTDTVYETSDGYRRLAAASAVAGLFTYALIVTITPAAINQISPICHNSDALVGWLFRVSMAGFFVCVLLGGRYSDKVGKLPVLFAGCVLMALGSFGFARVTTYPMAVLMSLVMGAGGGFAEAIAMGVIADVTSTHRRTSVMNLAQVFFAIGAVVGPLGVTWLLATNTSYWRWAFVVTAVICVLASVTIFTAISKREEKPVGQAHKGEWRELLKDKFVLTLSVGILFYVAAESGQASWLAKYFKYDLHTTEPMAAATVALFWGGIGLGRYFATWTSKHLSDYAIIVIAHAFALVCQVALLITHKPTLALIAVPLLGFGLAPGWPTIVSRASALHPKQSGTVLGIVVSAGALGAAIFPAAIGQAADYIGLRHALWICAALILANLFIFIPLMRQHRAQSSAQ